MKSCILSTFRNQFQIVNFIVSIFRGVFKRIKWGSLVLCLSLSYNGLHAKEVSYEHNNTARYIKYIRVVEQRYGIPIGLLNAVIRIESSYKPYVINIQGKTLLAKGPVEALTTITNALSTGVTNIDIGISQINYHWHRSSFRSVEEMLNPKTNIEHAGKLLASLFKRHGNWNLAIRHYHSSSPVHHSKYAKKVVLALIEDKYRGKGRDKLLKKTIVST